MSFANPAYSRLSVEEEERAERIIEVYLRSKSIHESGKNSSIEEILPEEPNLRTAVLIELIHADIERRICSSDELCFPEYFHRFPELQNDQVASSGIVRTEWQLRSERGQTFSIEQLLRTFQSATLANSSALKLNSPFHRYRLKRYLGEGAFGIVFLCEDVFLNRQVAVKLPHPTVCHAVDRERFLNEARLSSDLRHPNIVRLLEYVAWGNWTLLISEYVDGIDLNAKLREGPLPPEEACRIAIQIALALTYAHGRGLIHGDLKPANIIIDRDGNAFLTDFGLTVEARSGSTLQFKGGTPAYLAPELTFSHIASGSVSSDLFALGVVLLEMLTGSIWNQQQLESTRKDNRPQRKNKLVITDDRWASLMRICDCAMEENPANRFRTANDFAQVLETWLTTSTETALLVENERRAESVLGQRLNPRENRLIKVVITISLLTLLCFVALLAIDEPVAGRSSVADARTSSRLLTHSTEKAQTDALESAARLCNCFRELSTDPDNQRARDLLRDATEIYHKLLQEASPPRDWKGKVNLAEQLLTIADHQRALCLYEEATRSLDRLGLILTQQTQIEAMNQVTSALEQSETCIRLQFMAQFLRLAVQIESEKFSDAATSLKELRDRLRNLTPQVASELASSFPHGRIHFFSALLHEAKGDELNAHQLYGSSLSDFERWHAQTNSYESGWYLSMLRYRLARIRKHRTGRTEETVSLFKEAAEVFAASVMPERGDPGFFVAHCHLNASELCLQNNRPEDSFDHAKQCQAMFNSTYAKRTSSPTGMRLLAKASFFYAAAAVRMNDYPTAASEFKKAIQLYSACIDAAPSEKSVDMALVRDLAASHHGLANCLEELQQFESAVVHFCEAAQCRLSLCSNNADNHGYVSDLSGTLRRVAELSHRFPSKPQTIVQLADKVEIELEKLGSFEQKEQVMILLATLRGDKSTDSNK